MVLSDCSGLILACFPVLVTMPPTLIQCLCEIQRSVQWKNTESKDVTVNYEGHLESKERFAIQRYLLISGKKQNMQVL